MFRKSKALAKLRAGQAVRFCAMGHFLPFYVKYAAHYKFDAIWIDTEHRAMDMREMQALLALCRLHDIDALVRPPTRERTRLYRYLEDGASGFMFPFCSTPEIARQLVSSVKFPPLGNRGLDGAGLDGNHGIDVWHAGSTYTEDANRETFVVAQIEEPRAVAQVEEIAAVPGVDVLFIGPADLGLRLATLPEFAGLTMDGVVERVAAAAKKNNKAWGIATGAIADVVRYRKLGAQFMPLGDDFTLIDNLKRWSDELDTGLEE